MKNILLTLTLTSLLVLSGWSITGLSWALEPQYIDADELIVEESIVKSPAKEKNVIIYNHQNQKADHTSVQTNTQKSGVDSQHKSNTHQISLQPVVNVVDSPINKTHAVELKKSRQSAELETEQKIVEKLESSRLRDEQERFNRLFGGKSKTVVAQVSTLEVPTTNLHASTVITPKQDHDSNVYFGLLAGQITNLSQQVVNLNSFGSFGISVGSKYAGGLIAETKLYYSAHQVTPVDTVFQNALFNYNSYFSSNVQQLTGVFSLMYSPMNGRLQPYAGISTAYNLWSYQHNNTFNMMNFNCHISYQFCANGFYRTNSIDVGLNIGADIKLNNKVDIGMNLLMNVLNVYNNHSAMYNNYYFNSIYYGMNGLFTPTLPISLEESNWLIASINAKFYF